MFIDDVFLKVLDNSIMLSDKGGVMKENLIYGFTFKFLKDCRIWHI